MTNAQWYGRFNTRVDDAKSMGITYDGTKVIWDYCAGMLNNNAAESFSNLSVDEQRQAKQNAEEQYLAYIFIHNSRTQHEALQRELQNDFNKGSDRYPENWSQALMFSDKYSKSSTPPMASEGTSFA